MALRRVASVVAPAVATRRALTTAAAAATTPAPQQCNFETLLAEIRMITRNIETIESQVRELDVSIRQMESKTRGVYDTWFRSNGRTIYVSIGAGFVALGMVIESREREQKERHLVELKAAEGLAEARTCQALVAGALSDAKNVERSAKHSLPFLR